MAVSVGAGPRAQGHSLLRTHRGPGTVSGSSGLVRSLIAFSLPH
jgi:hypothetical protein